MSFYLASWSLLPKTPGVLREDFIGVFSTPEKAKAGVAFFQPELGKALGDELGEWEEIWINDDDEEPFIWQAQDKSTNFTIMRIEIDEMLSITPSRTMPYRDYLQSKEWKKTRKEALKRANYRCQICNRKDVTLNVHHRTYERRGIELPQDLIVLCAQCHALFHSNGKLQK